MTDTRERAREIVNRHLEYMDGLSRGQVMMKVSNAIAAVEEALATRTPPSISEDDVERVARSIHQARFKKPGHEFEPWEMDEGDHEYATRLARAAIFEVTR